MAEIIEVEAAPVKLGKKSRFTAVQDLVIAREVANAKDYTSPCGETKLRFEAAASKVNAHTAFKEEPIGLKPLQDRYKRMKEQYAQLDDGNQRLSGVGCGEMGELADLLMMMREEKDDFDSQKNALKTAERKIEDDKERMGDALVEAATKRKVSSGSEEVSRGSAESSSGGKEVGADVGSSSKKKKKKRTSAYAFASSEMDRFGMHLKDANLFRIGLERERLMFEQNKSIADRIEREKEREESREERRLDREERRQERLEHSKLELEKHKALLELIVDC